MDRLLNPEFDIENLPEPARFIRSLRSVVPPTTFKKGREYAESSRVSQLSVEAGEIHARVAGASGEEYSVQIRPSADGVRSHCGCPAWDKYGPHCKHVVAAALVYLARLRMSAEPAGSDTTPPQAAAGPALVKLETWLGLSALADYEFLYRLSPVGIGTANRHWVIDVRRQDAQTRGPVQVKRLLAAKTRIAPADERVLNELARRETRYDSRTLLSDEELCELVDLLRHRRVIYRGTPLSFSDQPARPQIRLESRPDSTLARIELSLPDGATLQLNDAIVLAGRSPYVLAGQTLYPVEPGLPPRLLRKWLLEPTMVFSSSQLDRLLTFFAAHLPRLGMSLKAEGVEVDEDVEPKFVLTLAGNPESVKAQLAARYGSAVVPVSPSAAHLGYATGLAPDGAGAKLFKRRQEAERAAARVLVDKGFKFDSSAQTYELSGDRAIEFWAQEIKQLPQHWERFLAQAPKVRIRAALKPRVRIGLGSMNWFELDADFAAEDQAVDLGAVRMWLASGKRFVPLKDGSFAEADLAEISRAADLLEEAGALPGKKRTRLPFFQAPALEQLSGLGSAIQVEAKARKAMRELGEASALPPLGPPASLRATLRHYQEIGLAWLWFLHRHGLSGILADDMGLGKTLQALALIQRVKDQEGRKPSLVVAPTSVLTNWEREVERFAPDLTTVVWHGQDRHERAERLKDVDLALTSYALVRRDGQELAKIGWRYLILDEAQNIKNADSATALACKSLPSDARLALTGTPLENRLRELWSIFDFVMPGFLGSAEQFEERFEQPIELNGSADVRERLRRRIRPFVLRRLKDEVAQDLPPKTEMIAYCEMDVGQAALYREVLEQTRRKVYQAIEKVGFGRSRISILAALMRLRQVCCDPRLLKLPPGTQLPSSTKLDRFGQLVGDLVAEGHRALVFSQFTQMLQLLTQHAEERGLPYLYLDGRTRDRMPRIDRFNDPSGPPLFFISLRAGGTGLNLTAADYVIHYDPWWNPAVQEQATDRTHRIGQTKAVFSYKLIVRGTVEEKILALQRRKKELSEGVLGTGRGLAKLLTEKDVDDLFSLD